MEKAVRIFKKQRKLTGMKGMDRDFFEDSMLYEDLTGKILEASFEVSKELGIGFVEPVYEKALMVALIQKGLKVESQVPLKVLFRKVIVGEFKADILVEDKILIELKAVSRACRINLSDMFLISY